MPVKAPLPLAELVARLVEKTTSAGDGRPRVGRRTFDVFRAFDRIGPPLTDQAEPTSFRRGRLTLRVHSSAWLTELSLMERDLLERLNGALPRPIVEEVRLVLGAPRPRRKRIPPPRLSPRQAEQVERWGSGLRDEKVRAAFEKAAATSLRRGPAPGTPYAGPPGPRTLPPVPYEEDREGDEGELSYGYGDRSVDRWQMGPRKPRGPRR